MGPWDGPGWVPVLALPGTHPATHRPHYPGYTPPLPRRVPRVRCTWDCSARGLNSAVGLKSVAQLTLSVLFSGFRGMTEVYNLVTVDNPNDHFVIPGNEKAGVSNPWTGRIFSQQPSINC